MRAGRKGGGAGPACSPEGGGGGGGYKFARVAVHALQELILDGCGVPSWGLAPLLKSFAGNDTYKLRRVNFSNNSVGDSEIMGRCMRELVGSQEKLTSIVMKGCGLGTRTKGGWETDHTVKGIWEGAGVRFCGPVCMEVCLCERVD